MNPQLRKLALGAALALSLSAAFFGGNGATGTPLFQGLDSAARSPIRAGLTVELIADNAPSGSVAACPDTSGNNHTASQSTVSAQPTKVAVAQNGHAALRFDGVDDFLETGDLGLAQPTTLIVAGKAAPSTPGRFLDGLGSGRQLFGLLAASGSVNAYAGSEVDGSTSYANAPVILTAVFSAGNVTIHANGIADSSGPVGANGLGVCVLGSDGAGGGFLTGDIYEVLIYSRAISDAERKMEENYLAEKYGIAISH